MLQLQLLEHQNIAMCNLLVMLILQQPLAGRSLRSAAACCGLLRSAAACCGLLRSAVVCCSSVCCGLLRLSFAGAASALLLKVLVVAAALRLVFLAAAVPCWSLLRLCCCFGGCFCF